MTVFNENAPFEVYKAFENATQWKAALMDVNIITDARDDVLRIGFGLYQDPDDVPAFCACAKQALS